MIIGSGPAGYTAAIYAARAGLNPVVYSGLELGGQLTTTTVIENYPGFVDGIEGPQLVADMQKQAERLGAEVRLGLVTSVDFSKKPYLITVDQDKQLLAESVIIATGASAKYLEIPGVERFRGGGVSACATCDGFFYRGKDVAVIGGGDTACEEALYLSTLCNKVYMIIRRDVMRASKVMQERVLSRNNIEVIWQSSPTEIVGDESGVTGIKVVNNITGAERLVKLLGVFMAVGHHPNSEIFVPWIKTNAEGYILAEDGSVKTNVEGVFVAGDVADLRYKQAITAAAAGCKAAIEADRYLQGLE